jgi:tetratricopeptide (TPR) repeat protein
MLKRLVGASALVLAACATTSAPARPVATLQPAAMSVEETLKALNAMCSAEATATPGPALEIKPGMGSGGFKADTTVAEAQAWFDYGLQLSHAFYHADAVVAMKRATAADPTCATCAWGEAWAEGPTLNYGVDDRQRLVALAAAERAKGLVKPGDAKTARLVDALLARYADPKAAGADKSYLGSPKAGEGSTDAAFGAAMQAIAADYPDELELSVLATHAMLIPVRGDDLSKLKPALEILERVLKAQPDDTGAIHYYIHATEFDGRPEDAIAYADRLGELAPAASHLVHMPAHTFFHAGRYMDAAVVNAEAIEADMAWVREGGDPSVPKSLLPAETGEAKGEADAKAGARPGRSSAAVSVAGAASPKAPLPMYYAHNLAFGLAGALMAGDAELALKYASHAELVYEGRPSRQRSYPLAASYVALARYAPDEALAIPAPGPDEAPLAVYRAYARGEALLTRGDVAGALAEARAISKVKDARKEPEARIARLVLEGRAAMAQGQPRKAAGLFARAAKIQEAELADSWDPPAWWYPVRRSAAAAWLEAGDFARAEAEATASLAAWKHDPLALWTRGQAEAGLGKTAESQATLAEARRLWRGDFAGVTAGAI